MLGFIDRSFELGPCGRRDVRSGGFGLSIDVCFFYTEGCQLDRVWSAQPVISVREGEREKRTVSSFSV